MDKIKLRRDDSLERVMYHYTSTYHLPMILEDGFLKPTESNLRADIENVKNVVWLTDLYEPTPYGLGLVGSIVDKSEIRITITRSKKYKFWKVWSRQNKINKEWAKILEKDRNPNNWYISEKPIPIDDFIMIENVKTGEVLWKKEG